jgi:hypothetical protein
MSKSGEMQNSKFKIQNEPSVNFAFCILNFEFRRRGH